MTILKEAVLVTGASRGIGRAVAVSLASLGQPVLVNFVNDREGAEHTCGLIREAGADAEVFHANVAERSDVDAMFAAIRARGYQVGTLVNNAGVARDNLLSLMTDDEWHAVLRTNLDGAYYCCRSVIRSMMVRKRGAIVNLASVSALRSPAGQANYAAAKAGLIAMTRSLAREAGRFNIRVNAVAPGLIETDMLSPLKSSNAGRDMLEQARTQMIALGRLGSAAEVASAVRFLVSDEASYLTGHVLVVDGGLSI